MGDENLIRTLGDYSKPSHEGYRNTIELPVRNNVVPLRSDTIRLVQNGFSFHGLRSEDPNQHLNDFLKLIDSLDLDGENRERTCMQDLALYDNESWNDPRDFAKLVKEITLPKDVPSTSDRRLIKLENQVQCLMEAHLALTQPTQVNKITTSCEICSGPHDTQYCMEDPEQAFVEYASLRTDEAGDARLSKFKVDFKQQQSEMTHKINIVLKAITDRIAGTLPSDTVKNPKLSTSPVLSARSYPTEEPLCSTYIHSSINTITIHPKQQNDSCDSMAEEENEDDYDRGCRKPSDLEDGFYRDTIKLGPEYATGMDDKEEVTRGLEFCGCLWMDFLEGDLEPVIACMSVDFPFPIIYNLLSPEEKDENPKHCDNKDTVEFDEFWFFVKDYRIRKLFLHCDSRGDLYPQPLPSPKLELLSFSPTTWHRRLGHPGEDVICRLDIYGVEMDNPNITMEEYIEFEAEKAHRHAQTFKWETVTYGKVRYNEDIDYFKDFEIDFAATVYKDADAVMSSPNHPTSDIEDAFSSNFSDYIPASPDYVPASPGKTYSSSSNNSFGVVPIVSPTLSLFHDDPYMKVMHAYYAKESPIPPPTIVPPSTMLSPMFNPQEFFLSEELLSPKKQGHNQSFSSTSALPQEFEMGESSRKTSLERHEEQIEEILNHLDELSLDRIEHIEDKIEESRAQIAKLQRNQMGNNNKIALARFKIANLEQIIEEIQVRHQANKESLLNAIYELKNSQKDHRTTRLDTSYSF
ncbi:hypothetical protein Tco_0087363 [Tanacetum coccineum]